MVVLLLTKSVFEEITGGGDWVQLGATEMASRAYCAAFGFIGSEQQKPVGSCSGGERNRIQLAKLLQEEANLLMLDEPTAGMGREDTVSTVQLVQRLSEERGFTLMLIEHDLEIVMTISDTITVLQGGTVISEGSPEEVSADEEVQRAYLGGAEL